MAMNSDYHPARCQVVAPPDRVAIDQLLGLLRPIMEPNPAMTVPEAVDLLDAAGRAKVLHIIDTLESRQRAGRV